MAEKIVIAELDIDVNALLKSTSALKKEIDNIKAAQKELTKEGKTSSKEFVQNAANLKTLNKAYNDNLKAISENTQAQSDAANKSKLMALALDTEVSSIKEARDQNKILNKLRNETNVSTDEGRKQLEQLNAKLDENNAFIKENADAYLQQKINVGNYSESIKEALGELNLFNGGIGGFISRSQEAGGVGNLLKDSLGGAAKGFLGMTKASLAFIATPIGAVITALVAAFAAIKVAMDRSETATNKIKVAFSAFSGIMNTVLKALEPVGEFLIDGIVMGMELAGKAAEKSMALISGGLSLLGFDSAAKSVSNFTNEIKGNIKEAQELTKAENELEASQRKSRLTQLEYQKDAEKLRQIRDDENKTIAERVKANEDLGKVLQQQLKDELLIAEQALKVAELRIKAEGATSENLDAQAEALTEIADIQERITGQESEQLTNRVALQKEARDKQKELQEKAAQEAIDRSRAEIDLFIAQQGFKKKSIQEEYDFNKSIYDKELADLQLRYDKGKVSKEQYEAAKLVLGNEYAKKNADLAVQNADLELQAVRDKNQQILDNDAFLSEQLLLQKQNSLNAIAEEEKAAAALRLENGVINQQEYNAAIDAINEENRIKNEELQAERDAAEQEKKLTDLENKQAAEEEGFIAQLEIEQERNEIRLEQELAAAEKSGADQQLIKDKYAQLDEEIERRKQNAKLELANSTLGNIATIFGKESKVGKAAAVAQTTIDTYKAATSAYSSLAGIPIVGPALGAVAAAAAVAAGIANVKKITSTKPKFEKGGIQEIGGKRHSVGGTKFYGEDGTMFEAEAGEGIGVLNRSAFSSFMDFNNRFGSGTSSSGFFQGGGIITQGVRQESPNLDAVSEAIANMPAPVVAVEEIQSVGSRFVDVQQNATF